MNRRNLKRRFDEELSSAKQAEELCDFELAFAHLERAHILGQRWFFRHLKTHWMMLKIARKTNDKKEIGGQIKRLAAVPLGWSSGWIPKGNTGGTNVNPLRAMPIPQDMQDDLAGFSVYKDVAVRIAIIAAIVMAVWAFAFISAARANNGELLTITADASETCEKISGMPGAEDILPDASTDQAFAIGGNRRSFRAGGPGRGEIFLLDLSDPSNSRRLELDKPASFRSFGGDLHVDENGVRRLFIANRGEPNHSIEIFRVFGEPGAEKLVHERTLSASGFVNPNDVHALSASSAFVTLDKRSAAGTLAEIWEGLRQQPSGRAVRIDETGMRVVADGLLSSNGIEVSHDGTEAFVGELVGRAVSVYAIDGSEPWRRVKRIRLPFAVDNLTLRDDGSLLVTGHPKLLTLARGYQHDESAPSPSQVALIDPRTGISETLVQDSGEFFSGSSVAVEDGTGGILVGTAFGTHILRCRTT